MGITTVLLSAWIFGNSSIGSPELPEGWVLPNHHSFDGAWRKPSPTRYLKMGSDLNCDGFEDSVFILQPVKGPGMGVFAYLQDDNGSYRALKLFDSRKAGDMKGRTDRDIKREQLWYRSMFGVRAAERGMYPTACGKGYMECGKGERRKVELACGGVDFFPSEAGGNMYFFWVPGTRKFQSAVMGD